jgi:hypothetical protein
MQCAPAIQANRRIIVPSPNESFLNDLGSRLKRLMLFELRRYEPRFRSLLPRAWTDAIRLLHPEERI